MRKQRIGDHFAFGKYQGNQVGQSSEAGYPQAQLQGQAQAQTQSTTQSHPLQGTTFTPATASNLFVSDVAFAIAKGAGLTDISILGSSLFKHDGSSGSTSANRTKVVQSVLQGTSTSSAGVSLPQPQASSTLSASSDASTVPVAPTLGSTSLNTQQAAVLTAAYLQQASSSVHQTAASRIPVLTSSGSSSTPHQSVLPGSSPPLFDFLLCMSEFLPVKGSSNTGPVSLQSLANSIKQMSSNPSSSSLSSTSSSTSTPPLGSIPGRNTSDEAKVGVSLTSDELSSGLTPMEEVSIS